MTMKHRLRFLLPGALALAISAYAASPPVVSNVRAQQRAGTKLVDITYDLADPDSAQLAVTIAVSTNAGATCTLPTTSFTGAVGVNQSPGQNKKITWNAGADWPGQFSANVRFRVTADDAIARSGMVLIPAGNYNMGNCMDSSEGDFDELPAHSVSVSAFFMDKYEVSKQMWDGVCSWATNNGYSFDDAGSGKAANHPAQSMTWYHAVKWCNARSQQEGRTPAYYTDAAMTVVYKTGQVEPFVRWDQGYRLPTEAEWEKAARGGLSGKRFPWGDTISYSNANYYAGFSYSYDLSYPAGYHPNYQTGGTPYTSPVGSFAANGYGLFDMTGNVWEWCWDWYGSYGSAAQTDPRGPASGSNRVGRGGSWCFTARNSRTADRIIGYPMSGSSDIGFRPVLPQINETSGLRPVAKGQ
jgi:formylglycine-generating enzyme required for sulfatase activity